MSTQFSDAVGVLKETREKYIKMLLNQNLMQQVTVSCLQNSSLPDVRKTQLSAEARKIYPVSSAQKIDGSTLTQWSNQLNQRKEQSVGAKQAKPMKKLAFGKTKEQFGFNRKYDEEEEEEDDEEEEEEEEEDKDERKSKKKKKSQSNAFNAIFGTLGTGVIVGIIKDVVFNKEDSVIRPIYAQLKEAMCAGDNKDGEGKVSLLTQQIESINKLNETKQQLEKENRKMKDDRDEDNKQWKIRFEEQDKQKTEFMNSFTLTSKEEAFKAQLTIKDETIAKLRDKLTKKQTECDNKIAEQAAQLNRELKEKDKETTSKFTTDLLTIRLKELEKKHEQELITLRDSYTATLQKGSTEQKLHEANETLKKYEQAFQLFAKQTNLTMPSYSDPFDQNKAILDFIEKELEKNKFNNAAMEQEKNVLRQQVDSLTQKNNAMNTTDDNNPTQLDAYIANAYTEFKFEPQYSSSIDKFSQMLGLLKDYRSKIPDQAFSLIAQIQRVLKYYCLLRWSNITGADKQWLERSLHLAINFGLFTQSDMLYNQLNNDGSRGPVIEQMIQNNPLLLICYVLAYEFSRA